MSIIRQGILFDMGDFFYDLEPSKRFEAVFSNRHIEPLLFAVNKKSVYGAQYLRKVGFYIIPFST